MNKNELGPIEEDILIEDVQEETGNKNPKKEPVKVPKIEPVKLLQNIQTYLLTSPKKKFISLMMILGIIVVIYAGLLLISVKPANQNKPEEEIEESPKAQSQQEKTLSELNRQIELFTTLLENLDNYNRKLANPIVNLDISFE